MENSFVRGKKRHEKSCLGFEFKRKKNKKNKKKEKIKSYICVW